MTTTEKTKPRFPSPVYAAAGVGELAYRQLQKLPAATAELREQLPAKVAQLRAELPGKVAELRTELPAKAAELRTEFPAKAAELRTELPAKAAELRTEIPAALTSLAADAYTTYLRLVKRGRKVVDGRGTPPVLKPVPLPEGVEAKPVVESIEPAQVAPPLTVDGQAKPKKAVAAKRTKPAADPS